jgi:large subunit ribosomal protein L22
MVITALQKSTRQTPRKLRLVASQVKKLSLSAAMTQLGVIERRATLPIMKVIRQAVANATHNYGIAVSDLLLKDISIQEGSRYKRFNPVSRGRAHSIVKRTSHILVTLETKSTVVAPVKSDKKDKTEEVKTTQDVSVVTDKRIVSDVKANRKMTAQGLAPKARVQTRTKTITQAKGV